MGKRDTNFVTYNQLTVTARVHATCFLPSSAMASDAMDIDGSSPEALRAFYNRLYPFPAIYKWLNQNDQAPSRLFTHREFAFTLEGDIYLRYQSFKDEKEFKSQVLKHVPTRFEIGPQYTFRVRRQSYLLACTYLSPAAGQEDSQTWDVQSFDARTCLRYRYDGLRPHTNVLHGCGDMQTVLGLHRRCRACPGRQYSRPIRL